MLSRSEAAQSGRAFVYAAVLALSSAGAAWGGVPIFYVDASAAPGGNGSSWELAFSDLHDALDAAGGESSSQIWVAAGVYVPGKGSTDRSSTFELVDGVQMFGGFAGIETSLDQRDPKVNKTVLSGNLGDPDDASDNAYHVLVFDDFFAEATLDGFIIQDGEATGEGSNQDVGGGLRIRLAFPTINNCVFRDNTAEDSGGAIDADLAAITITGCSFLENSAQTGGAVNLGDGGTIIASSFDGNSAGFGGALAACCGPTTLSRVSFHSNFGNFGGALFVSNDILKVKRCGFYDNVGASGGAAYVAGAGQKTFVSCRFGDCVSTEGGALWTSAVTELTNCQIVRSLAFTFGGGIFTTSGAVLDINNCTIAQNEALFTGAGVYLGTGSADIVNSILWKNKDSNGEKQSSQLRVTSLATATYTYNLIMGWEGEGEGNFQAPPKFVAPAGEDRIPGNEDDNYTLLPESPCIDAGNGDALPADTADLDEDGNTDEAVPADVNMLPRVLDDPNTPNQGANPDIPVDLGASEFIPVKLLCLGDLNLDGEVNSLDLNIFLFEFIQGVPGNSPADIDGDGKVTTLDLNLLLNSFGFGCDER